MGIFQQSDAPFGPSNEVSVTFPSFLQVTLSENSIAVNNNNNNNNNNDNK
jgi:hypothetical protein